MVPLSTSRIPLPGRHPLTKLCCPSPVVGDAHARSPSRPGTTCSGGASTNLIVSACISTHAPWCASCYWMKTGSLVSSTLDGCWLSAPAVLNSAWTRSIKPTSNAVTWRISSVLANRSYCWLTTKLPISSVKNAGGSWRSWPIYNYGLPKISRPVSQDRGSATCPSTRLGKSPPLWYRATLSDLFPSLGHPPKLPNPEEGLRGQERLPAGPSATPQSAQKRRIFAPLTHKWLVYSV